MILRMFVPFEIDNKEVDKVARTQALDAAINDLVTTYGFCRKWNFECSVPARDAKPGETKFERVRASVMEVGGKSQDTFFDVAGRVKKALNIPIYLEVSKKEYGKFV